MPERTARPRRGLTDKQVKIRSKVIIGIVLFMALLGPVSLLVAIGAANAPPPAAPPGFAYQGSAQLVVAAWVDAKPSPIAVAKEIDPAMGRRNQGSLPVSNVAWKSARFVPFGSQVVEAHRFSALMEGLAVEITVLIGPDGAGNPVAMSLPTLLPTKQLPGTSNIELDYKALGPAVQMTSGTLKAVNDWANAYVTDNTDALYKGTGDAQQRTYRGLPGENKLVGEPVVLLVVQGPNGPLARVRFNVLPSGWDEDASGFPTEMDVLFGPFDRDVPYVVAWGSSGDGSVLVPYINGFTPPGRVLTTPGSGVPLSTTTSTSTTTPTVAPTTTPPPTDPPPTDPPPTDPPAEPPAE